LEDSISSQVKPGRESLEIAAYAQPDSKPRRLHLADELLGPPQGRGRLADAILVRSKQTDQTAHLTHGLAARALDSQQRVALTLLIFMKDAAYCPCLYAHHADAVPDDVVQLARDAPALFCDRDARMFIPSTHERSGTLVECLGLKAQHTERAADHQTGRCHEQGDREASPRICGGEETSCEQSAQADAYRNR
jgi:hypothetical protein